MMGPSSVISPRRRRWLVMLVMMVVMVLARVEAQLVVSEENETECGEGECLVISKCPAVLKLVFKVRTPGFVFQSVPTSS